MSIRGFGRPTVLTFAVTVSALVAVAQPRPDAAINGGAGERIFKESCAGCHGEEAAGHSGHAESIPPPANLTLVRIAPSMFQSILQFGIPGTGMPPHPDVAQDSEAVYNYIASQPMSSHSEWAFPWTSEHEISPSGARDLYMTMCAGCHGPEGRGDGPWARGDNHIWPKPTNLRARSSEVGRLYHIISEGRPGTMMPAQAPKLSAAARWALAEYIYALFDPNERAMISHGRTESHNNPLSASDKDAVEAGTKTYDLYCAYCHGVAGGGSFLAPRLVDREWLYGGGTDNALFVVIEKGVPGKLMPAHRTFDEQQRWEVITYIRSRGGLPDPAAASSEESSRSHDHGEEK